MQSYDVLSNKYFTLYIDPTKINLYSRLRISIETRRKYKLLKYARLKNVIIAYPSEIKHGYLYFNIGITTKYGDPLFKII